MLSTNSARVEEQQKIHIRTAERIRGLFVPFPLLVSFRILARQEAQAGQ